MQDSSQSPPSPPLWRTAKGRAWIFQGAMILSLIWIAVTVYQNTLTNLQTRGISSGFGFFKSEAGFKIGETTGIPLPQGGVLWFLVSLGTGIILCKIISDKQKQNGKPLLARHHFFCLLAVLALPFCTLYTFRDSVEFIHYTESSTYTLALLTGLANTLKVTVIGCIASTLLGLLIALGRLSPNWLLSNLCRWYVELNRNLPLLLQLFFWYFIVFQQLPEVRRSLDIGGWLILNKRGLYLPAPVAEQGTWPFAASLLAAGILCFVIYQKAKGKREETGERGNWHLPFFFILLGLPAISWITAGKPFSLDFPVLKGFNYTGGTGLTPEFATLVTGLTIYVAAFNAEIIRAGIESVNKGQREAARSIGMNERQLMRLVILPQALRIIIPPLTSEYLAVAKNSSLAVAIGYPDFVSIGGTILNQSGQAVEIVGIWMGVYLCISLLISFGMNIYNAKAAMVER